MIIIYRFTWSLGFFFFFWIIKISQAFISRFPIFKDHHTYCIGSYLNGAYANVFIQVLYYKTLFFLNLYDDLKVVTLKNDCDILYIWDTLKKNHKETHKTKNWFSFFFSSYMFFIVFLCLENCGKELFYLFMHYWFVQNFSLKHFPDFNAYAICMRMCVWNEKVHYTTTRPC